MQSENNSVQEKACRGGPSRQNLMLRQGLQCAKIFTCSPARTIVCCTLYICTIVHKQDKSLTYFYDGCFLVNSSSAYFFFFFYPLLVATHYNKLILWPHPCLSGSWPTFEKYCVPEFQNDWQKGWPQRAGEVGGQSWDEKGLVDFKLRAVMGFCGDESSHFWVPLWKFVFLLLLSPFAQRLFLPLQPEHSKCLYAGGAQGCIQGAAKPAPPRIRNWESVHKYQKFRKCL